MDEDTISDVRNILRSSLEGRVTTNYRIELRATEISWKPSDSEYTYIQNITDDVFQTSKIDLVPWIIDALAEARRIHEIEMTDVVRSVLIDPCIPINAQFFSEEELMSPPTLIINTISNETRVILEKSLIVQCEPLDISEFFNGTV